MAVFSSNGGYQTINEESITKKRRKLYYGSGILAVTAVIVVLMYKTHLKKAAERIEVPMKLYDENNRFVMEDYDTKPTFSNFLPAIAGIYGKPVWAFYVNRGQGIASFGTESKEFPMLEFNAANKAYQDTAYVGFRTFIKGKRKNKSFNLEPFSPRNSRNPGAPDRDKKPKRVMYVGTNEMEVREIDYENGLTVNSTYIVLPMESFSSFVRRITYTNTGDDDLTFSSLDGVARFEPNGGEIDWSLKNMGRTLEGWMSVHQAEKDSLTMPYFKMSTEPGDTAAVVIEKGGHFCLSFVIPDGDEKITLLPIAYDPRAIFGMDSTMTTAAGFAINSVSDIVNSPQYGDAKTSSAMTALEETTLAPGESISIATFYGKTEKIDNVPIIADTVTSPGYVMRKFDEAASFVSKTFSGVETNSSDNLFNGAIKQTFLDNSLRGGLPTIMGDVDDSLLGLNFDEDHRVKVFHVYSRIHGDLERDYNAFVIVPTYFSQGPGSYRDVAQNRRSDVFFAPRMASFDVQHFLGFIQADGYEPKTVESISFVISDEEISKNLCKQLCADSRSSTILQAVLKGGPFRPGQILELIVELNIIITVDSAVFINTIVAASNQTSIGKFETGYWADHWEYYIDLINSYLALYPDGEETLMYDKELRYFYSPATCKPRGEKYILTLTYDGLGQHVLQLDATEEDKNKTKLQKKKYLNKKTGLLDNEANWQKTVDGVDFTSSPIAKLFLLGTLKFATRDAYGMGVEYEGGKPGWNDAMNGLVGMVGSGMPETYELQQLLTYINEVVGKYNRPIVVPEELGELIDVMTSELDILLQSGYSDSEVLPKDVPEDLFNYWNNVASARENYRLKVGYSFTGKTRALASTVVTTLLTEWLKQIDIGMERAMKVGSDGWGNDGKSGIPPCYFSFNVTRWQLNGGANKLLLPTVDPLALSVGNFPLFLEGPTRYMKTISHDKDAMRDMYNKVLVSGLRDDELGSYFLSASLKRQSYNMGRMMAFSPGWLENQSIWMHMAYKYYLQLLRSGLYEEFFSEMRGGGMLPYMDLDKYGRSLMECSSFLASSAFPDPSQHGRGFEARLSGSTAEFLDMWRIMFIGNSPFVVNNGDLNFQLIPALPIWLFTDENKTYLPSDKVEPVSLSFKLFTEIDVIYHNTEWTNLYGAIPKKYLITYKDETTKSVEGPVVGPAEADAIRRVFKVQSVDVYF